jgi:hypothetical protein
LQGTRRSLQRRPAHRLRNSLAASTSSVRVVHGRPRRLRNPDGEHVASTSATATAPLSGTGSLASPHDGGRDQDGRRRPLRLRNTGGPAAAEHGHRRPSPRRVRHPDRDPWQHRRAGPPTLTGSGALTGASRARRADIGCQPERLRRPQLRAISRCAHRHRGRLGGLGASPTDHDPQTLAGRGRSSQGLGALARVIAGSGLLVSVQFLSGSGSLGVSDGAHGVPVDITLKGFAAPPAWHATALPRGPR